MWGGRAVIAHVRKSCFSERPSDKCLLLLVQRDRVILLTATELRAVACWDQLTVETVCGVLSHSTLLTGSLPLKITPIGLSQKCLVIQKQLQMLQI